MQNTRTIPPHGWQDHTRLGPVFTIHLHTNLFRSADLPTGTRKDVSEALFEGKEWRLQPAIANGCEQDGDSKRHGIAEEVAPQA